jgi:hypothetical protein
MKEKEKKRMKTQGRTWKVLGALALLGSLLAGRAQAAVSDSLTVTITPNVQYAVDITTGGAADPLLDLGLVNLGASTFTVNVTTVEVQSTIAQTDLSIAAQVIQGGWSIDGSTAAQEVDGLQAWAVFTDTSVVTTTVAQAQPGAFDAEDVLQATPQNVGQFGAGAMRHMLTSGTGYKNMEDIPSSFTDLPASRSHLWLKFTLPSVTSVVVAQKIYVTVIAGAPN